MSLSHSLRVQVGGGGGGGGGKAADGLRLRNIRSVAATMQTTMTTVTIINGIKPNPPALSRTNGKRSWFFEFIMYGVSPIPSCPVTF
jgi:hypothetical protein